MTHRYVPWMTKIAKPIVYCIYEEQGACWVMKNGWCVILNVKLSLHMNMKEDYMQKIQQAVKPYEHESKRNFISKENDGDLVSCV